MKRRALLLSLLVLASACHMVGVPRSAPPAPPGRAPRPARPRPEIEHVGPGAGPSLRFPEVRGLWVVRTTLTSPRRIKAMVADAHRAGFNTLLVQVRGRGDAYYHSRWEPRAEALSGSPAGFDPLALVIREAHERGMAVEAWVEVYLVWSREELPRSAEHIVNAHPDWLAVPRELGRELYRVNPYDPRFLDALRRYTRAHARTVEGLCTSPSSPGVQERVYDVVMDLAEHYEVDGIHLDYIRYPSSDFDYSRGALDRFRSWVSPRLSPGRRERLDAAFKKDPYAFVDALPGPWDEFRRAQVTRLVGRIYSGVKARRPDVVVSAAVFADARDAYANRFQDWREWLRQGIVDVVVPMAYTDDHARFRQELREATVVAGRRNRVWAGIGAWMNTFDGTLREIDIARNEDVGGVVLFSYDWAATRGPSAGGVPYLERVGRARFGRSSSLGG